MLEALNTVYANPIARRVNARAALFAVCAQVFGYPGHSMAEGACTAEFMHGCCEMAEQVHVDVGPLAAQAAAALAQDADPAHAGKTLRAECTRLFWTWPRPISLEGHAWVRDRVPLAREKGEGHAVRRAYEQLGLRNRAGVTAASDSLASELDYASYVSAHEARAWEDGDVADAREWHALLASFVREHLHPLACGVADGVLRATKSQPLGFYAVLLRELVEECSHERA